MATPTSRSSSTPPTRIRWTEFISRSIVRTIRGDDTARIAPSVTFELRPPDGLKYEVLTGAIRFGKAANLERGLYIAVQGPDPADFADAVSDLQRCIELKSGAKLEEGAGRGHAIRLRRVRAAFHAHPEGYRLHTGGVSFAR